MNLLRWARVHWDRATGGALIGLGAIFLLVGWNKVGAEALTAQQIPYVISGGIGGLFLLGVGGMLWLSADLRDEWRKLDDIERRLIAAPLEDVDAGDDPFAPSENGREATASPRRARVAIHR